MGSVLGKAPDVDSPAFRLFLGWKAAQVADRASMGPNRKESGRFRGCFGEPSNFGVKKPRHRVSNPMAGSSLRGYARERVKLRLEYQVATYAFFNSLTKRGSLALTNLTNAFRAGAPVSLARRYAEPKPSICTSAVTRENGVVFIASIHSGTYNGPAGRPGLPDATDLGAPLADFALAFFGAGAFLTGDSFTGLTGAFLTGADLVADALTAAFLITADICKIPFSRVVIGRRFRRLEQI